MGGDDSDGDLDDDGYPPRHPPPRARAGVPPVPPTDSRRLPDVDALLDGRIREESGRGRFSASTPHGLRDASGALIRYRLSSLAVIRLTDRGARRMFLAYLREIDRRSFPEMQLIAHRLNYFAPLPPQQLTRPRSNGKDPPFEEAALPERLRSYKAGLSSLVGFFKPNRLTANYMSKELA